MRELESPSIDLHGGGSDLVFPHHECESAQSEAASGEPFVKHWMHQAMVRMDGEKMSKSLGNLVFVHDLLDEGYEAGAIRAAVLKHSYRDVWSWTDALMPEAAARIARWKAAGEGDAGLAQVRAALDNDLDTPTAIAAIDAAAETGGVSQAAALLGIIL